MIHDQLLADPGVAGFVEGRVFDGVPDDAKLPYLSFGPSDYVPSDAECINGREETFQIDVWDNSNGRLSPCRKISDAVNDALHDFQGSLAAHALASLRVTLVRVFRDPDGIVAHGVVIVTARIEVH